MPLVPMKEMLQNARKGGYAVGAFEFWSLESAQAVVRAAQAFNVPVVLQSGYIEAMHAGGYDQIVRLAQIAADEVQIPVALHWDHGEEIEHVKNAVDAGFTSVMIDCSRLSYEENAEMTRKVVELAKPRGITVESELGVLAGNEGNLNVDESEALQTTPGEARRFLDETGADAIAVAIGTAHGFYKFEPKLNIKRLREIAAVVPEPIVLHGGSGTPEEQIRSAVRAGICKVNICTEFIAAFGSSYINSLEKEDFKYNVPAFFGAAQKAGYELACSKIKLFLNDKKAIF